MVQLGLATTSLLVTFSTLMIEFGLCNPTDNIYRNEAAMEIILHSEDNIRTIKYIQGVYTSAGAVFKVEGNMEQVRHLTLAPVTLYTYLMVSIIFSIVKPCTHQ